MKCPFCKTEFESDSYGQTVSCPGCGGFVKIPKLQICPVCLSKSAIKRTVCVDCGYNFETGERIATKIGSSAEEEAGLLQKIIWTACEAIPGAFRLSTLLGFFICTAIALGAVYLALVVGLLGAWLSAFAIAAAALLIYLHGVAFLCYGELCFMKAVLGDITGKAWTAFCLLAALPLLLLLPILVLLQNGGIKC